MNEELDRDKWHFISDINLTERFNLWVSETEKDVSLEFEEKIQLVQNILNTSYSIGANFISFGISDGGTFMAQLHERNDVILSAYLKNLFSFYAALDLTKKGLYGPARSTLRHIFESLIIAKFCATSANSRVYEKWKSGGHIFLTSDIFKKLLSPEPEAFKEMWSILSEFTHATIYAQQITFSSQEVIPNIAINLSMILELLECHYHILGGHYITPSLKYYVEDIMKRQGKLEELKASRNRIRGLLSKARKDMGSSSKEFIKNYKSSWEFKPNY